MTTIRDVARRAGVSTMTVSRVINNTGNVNRAARERVEAAVAELGYVGSTLPRSLRSKQTKMLALVVSDITNPFFTSMARGVEDAASAQDFNVILCNTDESAAKQERYLKALVRRQVDGILLVPAGDHAGALALLQAQRLPVVLLDRRISGCTIDVVRGDSEQGAHDLVKLLVELGHRRIVVMVGPQDVSTATERVAGYRRALTEAGIALDERFIIWGHYTQASGYAMGQRAMGLWPCPTALLTGNNMIAIGALNALRATGRQVPDDIAIVSMDDVSSGPTAFPFFTVAALPANAMGREATQLLLQRITKTGPAEPQEVVLAAEVIIRESSGRPLTTGDGV